MQAMPSKNLAVSTVPLLMPYIQRRPETVGGQPFKLVSDYRPAGDQPEAIRQLIEGVSAGAGAGAQQDTGGAVVERDEDVLPGQRRRILRVVLQLLPAGSLRAAHRHL